MLIQALVCLPSARRSVAVHENYIGRRGRIRSADERERIEPAVSIDLDIVKAETNQARLTAPFEWSCSQRYSASAHTRTLHCPAAAVSPPLVCTATPRALGGLRAAEKLAREVTTVASSRNVCTATQLHDFLTELFTKLNILFLHPSRLEACEKCTCGRRGWNCTRQ